MQNVLNLSSPGPNLTGPYVFLLDPKGSGKALMVFKWVGRAAEGLAGLTV